MHLPPDPSPRDLLPPLLACLPTAFLAPRPPPALLPLLSPVLRQRVNFLASSSLPTSGPSNGWLPLLTWDPARAAKLPAIIERLELEPHPVSGELELEDVGGVGYRRLDEETLQCRLLVEQFGLLPVFVWCVDDEHGGTGPGWKLAELRSLEDTGEEGGEEEWFESQADAHDAAAAVVAASTSASTATPTTASTAPARELPPQHQQDNRDADGDADDDDDDYWAQYDATPGPSKKPSPAPAPGRAAFQMTPPASAFSNANDSNAATPSARPGLSAQEAEYFARYGSEVQPALDSHDPDEEHDGVNGESTLRGSSQRQRPARVEPASNNANANKAVGQSAPLAPSTTSYDAIPAPRPLSPASSGSSSSSSHSNVDRLEARAADLEAAGRRQRRQRRQQQHTSEGEDRAERGIRLHIGTDIKSLFRLARSVGMSRREFARTVERELGVLEMLEKEEGGE